MWLSMQSQNNNKRLISLVYRAYTDEYLDLYNNTLILYRENKIILI